MTALSNESLEAAIQRIGNPVELLRNSQRRAFSHGTVSGPVHQLAERSLFLA